MKAFAPLPLTPHARRRIELARTRFELTEAGLRELSAAITPAQLAQDALCRQLRGTSAAVLLHDHVQSLAARGLRPRPHVVSRALVALRGLLRERRRKASR